MNENIGEQQDAELAKLTVQWRRLKKPSSRYFTRTTNSASLPRKDPAAML